MQRDEIYLIDMWRIFVREWRWFAAVLLLMLLATFAYTHVAKPQWEATAWIQVGQIGQAPQGEDPKVEPFQRVIERLQTITFQNDVMQSMGFSGDTPETQLYRKSFKLEPQPYANLIKVSVRAHSRQQASQFAAATVAELQAIHQRLETTSLALAHERLDEIQAALQTALVDRDRLQQQVKVENTTDATGKSFDDKALASVLLASKNEDVRALQQARSELLDRLSPHYTYETSLPWPIYIPDHQASPNLALTWDIGIFLGLFFGVLAAIARNAARGSTSKPSMA